ncbi:MAG TPA: hypothetical protein VGJ94_11515 [Syntrophorhabdaceae bacterium]
MIQQNASGMEQVLDLRRARQSGGTAPGDRRVLPARTKSPVQSSIAGPHKAGGANPKGVALLNLSQWKDPLDDEFERF